MKKTLLLVALGLLTLYPCVIHAQTVTPATSLQLCPDNTYNDLDTIKIIEMLPADFLAGESGVTYSLILPTGFKFEPFTGDVHLSDSFTSGTFTVFPDSLQITYSLSALSATTSDTIIVSGLKVRTSTAGLAVADIDRGGNATHATNAPGANSHGSLSSGQALTNVSLTSSNISCNGAADGSITVNIATGNPPYDYSTDFGSSYPYSSSPFNPITAGGYIVTVRDNLGCTLNSNNVAIINEPTVINELSVSKTDMSCNGITDGTITAIANGGTGTVSFSIVGASGPYSTNSGGTETGLGAGLYDIYFEDANGCQLDASDVTIAEPSAITPSANIKTDISCNGLTDGSLTASASGGTGTISYSTNGVGGPYSTITGNTINNLGAATYDIYFQDANGCQLDAPDVTIIEPGVISPLAGSAVDISCNGLADGSVTANASGGTGQISYSINGSGGPYNTDVGSPVNNLSAATYDLYFQDANGCQVDGPDETVNEPALITEVSASRTNVTCNSANDGTITATATGGSGPITYSINGILGPYSFPNGGTATILSPGAYSIYYQDTNFCQVPGATLSITEPSPLVENTVTKTNITCNNANDGTITALASGGTSPIEFSVNGAGGTYFPNGTTANSLTAGNKDVYFRDGNNCLLDGTDQNIVNPAVISIPVPNTFDPTFVGASNGYIHFTGVSGGTGAYNYSIDNGSNYQTSPNFNNLSAGNYTLRVRDQNDCFTIYGVVSLNDPGNLTGGQIEFFDGRFDTTICNGEITALRIFNDTLEPSPDSIRWEISSNGATWSLISGATDSFYIISGPHTTNQFYRRQSYKGGDFATSNVVQRKISNGNTIVVTIPEDTICIEDGMQSFSGTPAPVSPAVGVFTLVSGSGLTDGGNGTAAFNPNLSGAGTFTVDYNYTNEFGCVSSNTADITVNENTSVSFVDQTNYLNTDPAFTLTGGSPSGGTYFGPGVFGNQFFPGLTGAGTFDLTYTQVDVNGCSDTDSLNVTVSNVTFGSIDSAKTQYCSDEPLDTIYGSPPTGGTANGFILIPGVLTPIDSVTAVINPNALAASYTLVFEYQIGASVQNVTTNILIDPAPVATLVTGGSPIFCENDMIRNLSGAGTTPNPVTQLFIGNGIISDDGMGNAEFNPTVASSIASPHAISFIYEDINGCNDTATVSLTVNPLPPVGFVITEPFTGDTLTDMKFCKNEDSLILKSNHSSGLFYSTNSVALDNSLGNGQAFFRPISTPVGPSRNISYTYQDGNNCRDTFALNVAVNILPFNFDYTSTPSGVFATDKTILNEFCTESDSVLLTAFFGFGKNGIGYFKMDPFGNGIGGIDTTEFTSTDSVYFRSLLQSGTEYDVRYIYTDTSTGCTDSVSRRVRIATEPSLRVQVLNYPGSPFLSNSSNDTLAICTNGDFIRFQGFNDSLPGSDKSVVFSQSKFIDSTEISAIDTFNINGEDFHVFNPDSASILGLHILQFDYTSNLGCKDKFTFTLEVLDTPSLNILIDSNVVSFDSIYPQLCQSVDTITFMPFASDPGFGTMWISPVNSNSPILDSDTLSDGLNDTLLIAYPSTMLNFNLQRDYYANYIYTDSSTAQNCSNQIRKRFRINPLPFEQFVSQNLNLEYCEYDALDTFTNVGSVAFLDTTYFVGNGFTNLDSFRSVLNPGAVTPDTTDQGTDVNFWYVFRDKNMCVDSIQSTYTIHPRPQIAFEIKEQGVIKDQFCISKNIPIQIETDQLAGTLLGNYTYKFDSLPQFLSQPNFQPNFFPTQGRDSLRVTFTSAAGCIDQEVQAVYIYDDPIAQFNVNEFCIIDPIQFNDNSILNTDSTNLPDSINSWSWQFTQFNISSAQNPSFDFDQPGLGQNFYNIELTVSNTIGCTDDTDSTYFFGEPPVADFKFNDYCAGQNILFENTSINDTAVSSANFKWSISNYPFDENNLIDVLTSDTNFLYQFNNPGAYALRFDLSTSYGCADTITKRLDIRPVIDLANGAVYNSNFNNDSIEWRPGTFGSNFTWEQAIPNNTKINQGPNGQSEQVWVTNTDGNYNPLEKSYVEGPCFDFSEVRRPMIKFDYFSDLAVNDGVALQYSKNRGQTWRTIGLEETGIEWYNESSISGNPGNQALGQVGWSIRDSLWREARHQLDTLRNSPPINTNNPFVRLRFALGSSTAGNGVLEGFAFSNIQIKERDKLTLIEHFTNINDANSRQGDRDHNELINTNRNRFDILDIQYHTDFPAQDPVNLDNSLEQGARSLFYGVSSIPRTVFEGNVFNNVTSTWVSNANILDNGKQRYVAQRILNDAKFDIDINVSKTNNNINGTVTYTAKQNLIQGREYTAFIAVIEKFIPVSAFAGGNIQIPANVEFRSIFKKFLPQASGTNIQTLNNVGDSRSINFNWNYNNVYNADSIYVVAFIQDNVTREVYQVATDDTSNIWIPNSIERPFANSNSSEFRLYPNPSSNSSILQLASTSEGKEVMTIYNQMGHTIIEEELITGTKSVLLNLRDYPAGVYIVQIAHPEYGIKKSKLVVTK